MSDILNRAKAHYAELPRREMLVPEWGDDSGPLKITWAPLTVRDRERIYAPDEKGRGPTGGEVQIRCLIIKACDANSRKLFDAMSEHALRYEVDSAVVGRIANAIQFGDGLVTKDGDPKDIDEQVDDAKNA